jgi:hypothetical protein
MTGQLSCLSPSDASLGPDGVVSGSPRRICVWCGAVVPAGARRDARFCGVRCRQASWRFGVRRSELDETDRPMRFAYADPPYPGKAGYYVERQEVDHASLVDQLTREYPDGWALSTSAEALRDVLLLCPSEVRVCAWTRVVRRTRSSRALSAWEPLLVAGGRPLRVDVVQGLEDALVYRGRFRAFPGALVGMKPPQFAEWMFRQLGASPGDRLDDVFPGSGAVSEAWRRHVGDVAERRVAARAGDASVPDRGDGSSNSRSRLTTETPFCLHSGSCDGR